MSAPGSDAVHRLLRDAALDAQPATPAETTGATVIPIGGCEALARLIDAAAREILHEAGEES